MNAIQGATRFRWLGWLSGIVGILAASSSSSCPPRESRYSCWWARSC
ncbi:MAG: hypothetical protein WDM88_12135 [Galbitalea sp.]